MKPVEFAPFAQEELGAAMEWYEALSAGLGVRFFESVEKALAAVGHGPSSFPVWDHDERVRKFALDKFPYVIFYRDHSLTIEVVAIAHTAREPGYWIDRT